LISQLLNQVSLQNRIPKVCQETFR